jgi:hypothetical protein
MDNAVSSISLELLKAILRESITETKNIQARIQQIDEERQSLIQELLRRDGEIRVLEKILKSTGV